MSGYYRDLSDHFFNPSAVDVMRGSRKLGADTAYRLNSTWTLNAQYLDEKDTLNDMDNTYVQAGAVKTMARGKFYADISHENTTRRFVGPPSPDSRSPFDNSEELVDDVTAIRAGADYRVTDDLSVGLSHKQDVRADRYRFSEAGLSYRFNPGNRGYARQSLAKYDDRQESRTSLGVESEVAKNTVAYSEYRIDSRIDGTRNQEVMGLRNRFHLGDGVTGNLSAEHQGTISGPRRQSEPDAFAIAGAMEYLPDPDYKLSSRLEYRREMGDPTSHSYLGEVAGAYRLSGQYSLLARERVYLDRYDEGGRRLTSRLMIGTAYRPDNCDRFNALAKVTYETENDSMDSDPYRTEAVIPSIEGVYQARPDLQLIGKYAGKWFLDTGFSTYTDLVSGRILYDLTDRFDVGLTYRVLTNHSTMSRSQGGAAEVGFRVVKNLWLSAGYSFDRFDTDLTEDGFHGEGPYVRLRFKFDEDTARAVVGKVKDGAD